MTTDEPTLRSESVIHAEQVATIVVLQQLLAAANARADAERKAREEAEQIQSTLSKSHHEACVKGGEYAQRAESAERELAELAELRHDIARAVQTTSEFATENAELRQHAEALALRGIENKVSHMAEQKERVCPACKGVGVALVNSFAVPGKQVENFCSQCKGTGRLPEILEDVISERDAIRLALLQERERFIGLLEDLRDTVLNQRGALAENGMSCDQVNDVLAEFDNRFDVAAIRSLPDPCDVSATREMMKDVERYRWIMSQAKITDFIFTYTKSTERHVNNAIDFARGDGDVCATTMHPTVATQEHG